MSLLRLIINFGMIDFIEELLERSFYWRGFSKTIILVDLLHLLNQLPVDIRYGLVLIHS